MFVVLLAFMAAAVVLPRLSCFAPWLGAQDHALSMGTPLTDSQVQALVQRVLDNQRRDDHAIWEYARTEHWLTRSNGRDPDKDVLNRVVPTGYGQARVELAHDGKPADPMELEKSWAQVEQELIEASHPGAARSKGDSERFSKRRQDEDEAVASIGNAFNFHFVGRKEKDGHAIVQLSFEPNPSFRPSSRVGLVFVHTRGTVWVDESNSQLVRLEAELSDDISYAAGLIAKVYRGGRLTFEQQEASPGIWLPTHTTYDFDGKKFVFGTLSLHQRIDASQYRRVGPPDQALALVRQEHPSAAVDDP
jgi:hypothetical protein